jgi:hypothetical protein
MYSFQMPKLFSAVRNGFRTMRDTRGAMELDTASVGVKTAGGGGSGNMSRYRAGNWCMRCGRPDKEGRASGRGGGREREFDWDSASVLCASRSASSEIEGYSDVTACKKHVWKNDESRTHCNVGLYPFSVCLRALNGLNSNSFLVDL